MHKNANPVLVDVKTLLTLIETYNYTKGIIFGLNDIQRSLFFLAYVQSYLILIIIIVTLKYDEFTIRNGFWIQIQPL